MHFNEPMAASEVDKAQANIDSILGGGMEFKPSAMVLPINVDASGLFDFAGMDTNRTHVSFNFSSTSEADQPAQNDDQ